MLCLPVRTHIQEAVPPLSILTPPFGSTTTSMGVPRCGAVPRGYWGRATYLLTAMLCRLCLLRKARWQTQCNTRAGTCGVSSDTSSCSCSYCTCGWHSVVARASYSTDELWDDDAPPTNAPSSRVSSDSVLFSCETCHVRLFFVFPDCLMTPSTQAFVSKCLDTDRAKIKTRR